MRVRVRVKARARVRVGCVGRVKHMVRGSVGVVPPKRCGARMALKYAFMGQG